MTANTATRWVWPGYRVIGVAVDQHGAWLKGFIQTQVRKGAAPADNWADLRPWRGEIVGAEGARRFLVAAQLPGYARVGASVEVDTVAQAVAEAVEIQRHVLQAAPRTIKPWRPVWIVPEPGELAEALRRATFVRVLPRG